MRGERLKAELTNKDGTFDITNIIDSLTISGEYRSPVRNASFGIVKSRYDENTFVVGILLGDKLKITHSGETLFKGFITKRNKTSDGSQISYNAKDDGLRLTRNEGKYNFTSMTPEQITTKVCDDFNIEIDSLYQTNTPISRVFFGNNLYDIIMTSYNLTGLGKFICYFEDGKLSIVKKGEVFGGYLQYNANLLTTNITESIEDLVNKVTVYNSDGSLVKTYENTDDIENFGLFVKYVSAVDNDDILSAEDKLCSKESTITVTNFGDVTFKTGKYIHLKEPFDDLEGVFYIDMDEHNFKNGVYSNKMTLNYENIADTTEVGKNE